jgi:hypothetical protein
MNRCPDFAAGSVRAALLWFAAAFAAFWLLAIYSVDRVERVEGWEVHRALVLSTGGIERISNPRDEYVADYQFAVDFPDGRRSYRARLYHGSDQSLRNRLETTHAPGQVLEVRINPEDRNEFAFPGDASRIRLVGYGVTALFACFGISCLRGKVPPRPPDGEPPPSGS